MDGVLDCGLGAMFLTMELPTILEISLPNRRHLYQPKIAKCFDVPKSGHVVAVLRIVSTVSPPVRIVSATAKKIQTGQISLPSTFSCNVFTRSGMRCKRG